MKGHTEVRELLDCTVDVWVIYSGNEVDMGIP